MPNPRDYSIIIPAYNEERYIPRTLDAVRRAMSGVGQPGELIVVDNNSSDRTADIAESYGARVIFEKINQISRARNTGAAAAQGRFLVFIDADTIISTELLNCALVNLASGSICGGGTTIKPDKPLKPVLKLGLDFWNRFSLTFKIAAGSFIYCRRDGFEAMNGFSEKVFVGEEIWFSKAIKRWGKCRGQSFQIIDNAPAVTSTRKLEWFSPHQTLLMLMSMFLFPIICRHKQLCRFWYVRPTHDHPPQRTQDPRENG